MTVGSGSVGLVSNATFSSLFSLLRFRQTTWMWMECPTMSFSTMSSGIWVLCVVTVGQRSRKTLVTISSWPCRLSLFIFSCSRSSEVQLFVPIVARISVVVLYEAFRPTMLPTEWNFIAALLPRSARYHLRRYLDLVVALGAADCLQWNFRSAPMVILVVLVVVADYWVYPC